MKAIHKHLAGGYTANRSLWLHTALPWFFIEIFRVQSVHLFNIKAETPANGVPIILFFLLVLFIAQSLGTYQSLKKQPTKSKIILNFNRAAWFLISINYLAVLSLLNIINLALWLK